MPFRQNGGEIYGWRQAKHAPIHRQALAVVSTPISTIIDPVSSILGHSMSKTIQNALFNILLGPAQRVIDSRYARLRGTWAKFAETSSGEFSEVSFLHNMYLASEESKDAVFNQLDEAGKTKLEELRRSNPSFMLVPRITYKRRSIEFRVQAQVEYVGGYLCIARANYKSNASFSARLDRKHNFRFALFWTLIKLIMSPFVREDERNMAKERREIGTPGNFRAPQIEAYVDGRCSTNLEAIFEDTEVQRCFAALGQQANLSLIGCTDRQEADWNCMKVEFVDPVIDAEILVAIKHLFDNVLDHLLDQQLIEPVGDC